MLGLWQDLRYGAKTLVKNWGFTVVAVASLALGIGANTTIFSFANALLLRPLPVEEPERLVAVTTSYVGSGLYGPTSLPDYEDLRDRNEVFSGVAAHSYFPMALTGDSRPEVVMGQLVTWNYFSVLGVEPFLGRSFLPEEDQNPASHPVAILSYRIWESRFGSDTELVGKIVHINDFGTGTIAPERMVEIVREQFPLTPREMITDLDLLRPIYALTAHDGHFGRELPEFTWEMTHHADELRAAAGL